MELFDCLPASSVEEADAILILDPLNKTCFGFLEVFGVPLLSLTALGWVP